MSLQVWLWSVVVDAGQIDRVMVDVATDDDVSEIGQLELFANVPLVPRISCMRVGFPLDQRVKPQAYSLPSRRGRACLAVCI
jgi:hypothetical protein